MSIRVYHGSEREVSQRWDRCGLSSLLFSVCPHVYTPSNVDCLSLCLSPVALLRAVKPQPCLSLGLSDGCGKGSCPSVGLSTCYPPASYPGIVQAGHSRVGVDMGPDEGTDQTHRGRGGRGLLWALRFRGQTTSPAF